MFKSLPKENHTITPIDTYKKYVFNNQNLHEKGVKVLKAKYFSYENILHAVEPELVEEYYGVFNSYYYNAAYGTIGDSLYTPYLILSQSSFFSQVGLNDDQPSSRNKDFHEYQIFNFLFTCYYKYPNDPYRCYSVIDNPLYYRNFHSESIVINIAQSLYGDKIKPGSVKFYNSTHNILVEDDGIGNLIDRSFSSYVANDDCIGFWNFDETFFYDNKKIFYVKDYDRSRLTNDINLFNCRFIKGVYGHCVEFDGSSGSKGFGVIRNRKEYDFRLNDNFTISFWVKCPPSQSHLSTIYNTIIEKYDGSGGYPFSVKLINQLNMMNGHLIVKRWNTQRLMTLFSTNPINDDQWHHVAIVKSGSVGENHNDSVLRLYIDGVMHQEELDYDLDMVHNSSNIYIGASIRKYDSGIQGTGSLYISGFFIDGGFLTSASYSGAEVFYSSSISDGDENSGNIDEWIIGDRPNVSYSSDEHMAAIASGSFFKGCIDEIRIYERALNQTEIMNLRNRPSNSRIIGNIIYSHGNIIFTNLIDYPNLFNGDYFLEFNSQHRIYEHEFICEVNPGEFMCTLNKSIVKNHKTGDLKEIFYNEEFSPYITTIGLYNDNFEMLAVGKLSRPIKKPENSSLTFILKLDA